MNKKQFLDIMDDIGGDLIENFLDIPSERFFAPKRTPLWKTFVSAAAAVCVLTAGLFAAFKLQEIQSAVPNDDSKTSEAVNSDNSVSLAGSNPKPTKDPGDFSFSLEGRDDLYYGISGEIYNSDWENPAVVKITYGSLSTTRRVYLCVTGDANWPEDHIMTDVVMVDSITGCKLTYNDDYGETLPVYLLAITGDDEVTFEGYWVP